MWVSTSSLLFLADRQRKQRPFRRQRGPFLRQRWLFRGIRRHVDFAEHFDHGMAWSYCGIQTQKAARTGIKGGFSAKVVIVAT